MCATSGMTFSKCLNINDMRPLPSPGLSPQSCVPSFPLQSRRARSMSAEPQFELFGLDLQELSRLMEDAGQPTYRARQVFDALYAQRCEGIERISTLPKEFRQELTQR